MTTLERNWQTSRLIARPATSADAQVIYENYASDPGVTRHVASTKAMPRW
jgi:hypothetical protein